MLLKIEVILQDKRSEKNDLNRKECNEDITS